MSAQPEVAPLSIVELLASARAGLLRLDPRQTVTAVEAGAVLVDIRPAAQRTEEGDVPGALLVERNVLEWRFDPASEARLPVASYDLHIVVLCSEGYTSSLAAAALQQVGVRRATDVIGGFQAWRTAGLPTTGGAARLAPSLGPGSSPRPVPGDRLTVHAEERRSWVDGRELDLTRLEFDLLVHLVDRPHRVHTRAALLSELWDGRGPGVHPVHTRAALLSELWDGRGGGGRTVDVHVHRLRSKLGEHAGQALQTVRGVGYRWSPPAFPA